MLIATNARRLAALLLLVSAQPLAAQDDTLPWSTAARHARRLAAATPALTDRERERYRHVLKEARSRRDSLDAVERALTLALAADRAELRAHADSSARRDARRAAWRDSVASHNARCDRRFTAPADVARCDASGARLERQGAALDSLDAGIDARSADLGERQAGRVRLADDLQLRRAELEQRLRTGFNEPLERAFALRSGTTTLRLTGKSYISVVDLASMRAESRPRAEHTFAWFTNMNFSEDPPTPAPGARDYRLWSQVNVVASCREDTLTAWKISRLAHRGGKELHLLDTETSVLEPLAVRATPLADGAASALAISYAIRGKPNDAALSSFQRVQPRTCHSIWHRVQGTVTCSGGIAALDATAGGSRFPSMRVWANDSLALSIAQGPFSALWDCDPAAPDRVR